MNLFGRTRRKHRILILGPEAAGKTTIMYRLTDQPVPEAMVPTAAKVLEKPTESPNGHRFIFSEQKSESPGASAIIYVLTRSDLQSSVSSLKKFLGNSTESQAPLLVLVNKQDLAETDELDKVCAELAPLVGIARSWAVCECSGTQNTGINDAMEWLQTKLPVS